MVLLGHAAQTRGFPPSIRRSLFFDVAHFGVSVFFILSGFLISTLLIEERRRTGAVSLRDFYIRRTIRIFPAAYLYVITVAILGALGIVVLRNGDLMHAVTYTMNYHHQRGWVLGHLWSLGVEEQFYLLWPLSFLLLGERRGLWVAVAIIAVAPGLRVAAWMLLPAARIGIDEEFQFVCDGLATGCLLALLVARYGIDKIMTKIPRLVFLIAPVAAVLSSAFAQWPSFYLTIGATITNLSISIVALWCIVHAHSVVGQLLNARAAIFLGTISYSLYLWQQLFMDTALMPASFAFPANAILAMAAATGSYYLLERPLLALRQRFRR
jgi:peptidoglycan/LPS O-acetylase OafA/YrhL